MTALLHRESGVRPELTPADQRRGFQLMTLSTVIAFVGDEVFAGNILMIIALHFKATEGYIGLLWFLILGSSLLQLFIVGFAQQRSKKVLLYVIYGFATVCSLPALGLDHAFRIKGVWAALAVLAVCVGLRQTVYSMATPCWMGLLRQMTPAGKRGRWLGLLRTSWQSSLVLTLLLTGLYLGRDPEWHELRVMIILGILSQVIRTLCIVPVPSIPPEPPSSKNGWWEAILAPIRDRNYRPFLLYSAFFGLALGLQEGFRLVYLVRLGFGQNLALVCSSLTALGAVVTLFAWGRLADRFGNHGVFSLTLVGLVACILSWFFVSNRPAGLVLAMVLFFLGGVFNSGNGLVQTRYLFSSLKPELEASYLAVTYLVLQQSMGMGALLGGQILTLAQKLGFRIGETGINNFQILFLTSTLIFVVPWLLRRQFKEPSDAPTRHMVAVVLQPIRTMVGSLVLWTTGQDKEDDQA